MTMRDMEAAERRAFNRDEWGRNGVVCDNPLPPRRCDGAGRLLTNGLELGPPTYVTCPGCPDCANGVTR